ncbi:MAG TPA: hypothetical protein DE315_05385 [Candidatus Omnitrophica bacterium]|nr:hypothetical protein [Candidatus Omnitrophota bacterium]
MKGKTALFVVPVLLLLVNGCASTTQQVFTTEESQAKLRSVQTRAFDTNDKNKMMRNVISTLQDLDFVIDNADLLLGSVSATKFANNQTAVKATVTVRDRGEKQLLVRLNVQYGLKAIEDPEPYQDFFNSLGKAIFLTAHQVD